MADWVHMISAMRGQWVPGDERGFHSRRHRIHCHGAAHAAADEHAGLRSYARASSGEPVRLTPELCERIGRAMLEKFRVMRYRVSTLACSPTHSHALVLVGCDDGKAIFGRVKQFASHAVRDAAPGSIWGRSSGAHRVPDAMFREKRLYIWDHRLEGAWVCDEDWGCGFGDAAGSRD